MKTGTFVRALLILCAVTVGIAPCGAQTGTVTGTPGQPLYAQTTTSGNTDAAGTVVDVYVQAGGNHDMCADINTVWTNNPTATLDARGYQGAGYICAASPFPSGITGRLLLGNVVVPTDVQWVIPSGVEVVGLGVSSDAGSTVSGYPVNTVIAASSAFPATGKAILEMGSSSGSYGIKIKDLTVDCTPVGTSSPRGGCIGIENVNAGKNSSVEDVAIDNPPAEGLHVSIGDFVNGLKAAFSGPYRNVTVQYPSCTTPCSSTYGVIVDCGSCTNASPIPVHFDNITAQGAGPYPGSTNGFLINGVPVLLANSHFENYSGMNVQVGGTAPSTNNVRIENVSTGTGGGVLIAPNSYNLVLAGVSGPNPTGGNPNYILVQNEYVNLGGATPYPRILGPFLGFYMFGGNTGKTCGDSGPTTPVPCEALLDTSPNHAEWHQPAN